MLRLTKRRLATAVAAVLCTGQLQAQIQLQEIVVTAQKRSQSLQDVPVKVDVVSGDTFEQNVAFELEDLNKFVPGLYMNGNKSNPNIAMRGVATTSGGATTPRTNIFVDGGYIPNQQLSFFTQFDIERFEVLRGPQGTLYGKASPTASIIIHTRDPDLSQTEGYVKQTVGEHQLVNSQFGVSIPLIEDELAVRIAGLYDENNSANGEWALADEDQLARNRSGRITLVWEPHYAFSGRLSHTYVDWDSNEAVELARVAPNTPPLLGLPSQGVDVFERESFADQVQRRAVRINQTILELNYDVDWAELTSQTYYAESTNDEVLDDDGTPLDASVQNLDINFGKLFNQELRLASNGNEFWDWIAGVYYANTSALTSVDTGNLVASVADGGALGFAAAPLNIRALSDVDLESAAEDWGVFTHNSFYLTDQWTLTVGARWNRERRTALNEISTDIFYQQDFGSGFTEVAATPGTTNIRSNETTWIDWTGTVKLAYNFQDGQMFYATFDRGGRIGGQTLDLAGTTPSSLTEYEPESSDSFEIGYKGDMLDRRLRINLAAYYQVYDDFQFFTREQPLDTNLDGTYDERFRVTQNAKEVVSKGAEVELTYIHSDNLSGTLNVSYNDTKFEDFDNAVCADGERTLIPSDGVAFLQCDRSGERLGSDAGNWGVNAMANYTLPIKGLGSEWYLDVLYNFTSKRISPFTRVESGSYATVDLFTGLRQQDGTWDVKFWVKNAFDREAVQNRNFFVTEVFNGALTTGVTPNDLVINPRQIGVTGTYRF